MSGEAASLAGKLGFAITEAFGRVGRARIGPIKKRAYSRHKSLGFQLQCCLLWWLRFLKGYRPREIPANLTSMQLIVSYSDGEGSLAGVGAAAWTSWLEFPVATFAYVPECLRDWWKSVVCKRNYKDIYLVEAVGPLLLLTTFPRLMRNSLWVHYVDNESAEVAMFKGSSTLDTADHIVGLTWERCAKQGLIPYFDRVESKANPVDKLPRGDASGPWRSVVPALFPLKELCDLARECGGWSKHAAELPEVVLS